MFLPDAVIYDTLTCMEEKLGLSAVIKQARVVSGMLADDARPQGDAG
jgi:hypothetical protein